MKKNIWILIIMLIFMTGCTAEYNLKIDDVTYKESLLIAATTNNEVSNLNQEWQIPVNKDNYCLGDEDTDYSSLGDIYNYKFNNNRLTFSHDFQRGDYANSTIVSECYKTLTVTTYEKKSIISTSNTANCFDAYPELTSVIVNITVDGNVVSSNADSVSSNKYTWKLNKNNAFLYRNC